MTAYKKKFSFSSTEEICEIQSALEEMEKSPLYNTSPSFSIDTELYPDNLIPFTDKHMGYLKSHHSVKPRQYISNLRLMTRIR